MLFSKTDIIIVVIVKLFIVNAGIALTVDSWLIAIDNAGNDSFQNIQNRKDDEKGSPRKLPNQ
jgi:hypothetical protein